MFNKLKQFLVWVKAKTKHILIILGIGVCLAAGDVLINPPIPADLQLKTTSANILYSQDFTQYQYDASGTIISVTPMVEYGYKSGEIAPTLDNEIIEQRTPHIVYRNLGGNKRSAQSGYNFYKEGNDWKQVKFATTTKEVFDKQTSWLDILIAWAADTGTTSPGTMADDATVGTVAWNNPDYAKASDNAYAAWGNSSGATRYSHYLKATNFGFSIPSGATINGILVEIERVASENGSNYVKETEVKIVKADGTIGTTNKADTVTKWQTTTDAYYSYGGASDLWNETWDSTKINDVDFGVVLATLSYGAGGVCLHKDTLITTNKGLVKIKDLKIDDLVLSYNEKTKTLEYKKVTQLHQNAISNYHDRYFYIHYGNKIIKATENHLFFVDGSYVRADELKVGNNLLGEDLNEYPIKKIEIIENTTDTVWDLTVNDNHNFFAEGILVHNVIADVDHIRITVYYTEGGGGAVAPQMQSIIIE